MKTTPNFAPLLSHGFCAFAEDLNVLVNAFVRWQNSILEPFGASLEASALDCNTESGISLVLPLVTPVPTRYLFSQLTDGWISMISNSHLGADSAQLMQISRICQCTGVKAMARGDAFTTGGVRNSYGATIFESFNSGDPIRSVFCANDGGRWKFGQSGVPYSCEDLLAYSNRSVKTRFDMAALTTLLAELKIFPIRADRPGDVRLSSVLVSRRGELPTSH